MTSASSPGPAAWTSPQTFRRLHPNLQEWVRDRRWTELRPLQVAAAQHILSTDRPLILSAGVASGKTEAAFLPLLTALPNEPNIGFEVVYIAPLIALIDDQARRLESLAAAVARGVTPWHGEVAQSVKAAAKKAPQGVLLITPESLDSYLSNHAQKARTAFGSLRFVVIDELHAFLSSERGKQLQSVLARLDQQSGSRPRRIGLSATLGDISAAQRWLQPAAPDDVEHIGDPTPRHPPQIEIFGLRQSAVSANQHAGGLVSAVAQRVLRGRHLVFVNGRKRVEEVVDELRPALQALRSPAEVFAHHSNIAKTGKKSAEKSLHEAPDTCLVCTSTLELGIDVPQVASVAQIGAPPAVASLKQRAGRSGRGAARGYLHVYCAEREVEARSSLIDRLHPRLVQAIAMVELMLEGWIEPPHDEHAHLSTLVHQSLALLLQKSGATPREMWAVLCRDGAFRVVDWPLYRQLLSQMKACDLVRQDDDGPMVHLGTLGARIATHYTFPVIFETPMEWALLHDGKELGTLPRVLPTLPHDLLIFAGRRWQVVAVDQNRHILDVKPSTSGVAPDFGGDIAPIHDRVRQKMREVYLADHVPESCRGDAASLLADARVWFGKGHLLDHALVPDGDDTLLFHWMGDRAAATLKVMLGGLGLRAVEESICLRVVRSAPEGVGAAIAKLAVAPTPDPVLLARTVPNNQSEKYDRFLGPDLLSMEYARRTLDVEGAMRIVAGLAGGRTS